MSLTSRRRIAAAFVLGLAVVFVALAAPAVLAQGGVDLPTADPGRTEKAESFVVWMIHASGLIGLLILVMSIYLVALIVWMSFHFRRSVAIPDGLVREVGELLNQKQYGDAYQRLLADPSFFARVLAAGVRKLPAGLPPALRAMELANDDASMEMEHRTTYLATVGTLGPMIGLVGTVYGMIKSFQVIATAGSSPQASALASGISTALFATLEGIALAVPAIYFHAIFRNRIARLSLEVALAAEGLLDHFSPGVRSTHPLVSGSSHTPTVTPTRTALPTGPAGPSEIRS